MIVLGVMLFTPSIVSAHHRADSLVMQRIFSYKRNYTSDIDGTEQNIYMKYTFQTERRNPTLFLVPTMYTIARGDRQYIGESYGKMKFRNLDDYDLQRQVVCGTIPRNRRTMPAMLEFMTPALYDVSLYRQHLLSPFNVHNRRYYRYDIIMMGNGMAKVNFRPRLNNTQLISGWAYASTHSGRIVSLQFSGEYDMIAFRVEVKAGVSNSLLPERCTTTADFHFMGNRIHATFSTFYNCPTTLPDSVEDSKDRQLMEQLRPVPLSQTEQRIIDRYDMAHTSDTLTTDSVKRNRWKEIAWDIIGDHLVNSISTSNEQASVHLSPLINPLYLSYSHQRGLSYKIKIGAQYNFSAHRYLSLNPSVGYNFKFKEFYFTAPLRMTYNPKRNGYAEVVWANGNRITNSSVLDIIKDERRDTIDFSRLQLDYFTDNYLQALNNVVAFDWLEITSGIVYHQRTAINAPEMELVGKPTVYRSFAPFLTLKLTPWRRGPVLTANYERSIKRILRSNINYERWEFDASYKKNLQSLRLLNFRLGCGFYTNKGNNYFVDFANFRNNNLPEGWDDEWTGQFQLLDSRWYNASDYYLRGHVSYESPLLFVSWMPLIGRFIETERIYISSLSIQHTRPYYEIGYGLTNRFFSVGLFASLLNERVEDIGCKFTFELFRRW